MIQRRFSTALREDARRALERFGNADIVVGIPSFNSQDTVSHVIMMAAKGLREYFPNLHSLIIVADGGSTDDTREVAKQTDIESFNIEKIVTIYRGYPGKGSAVRAIFEAAKYLNSRAVILLDSDLKSITARWIPNLVLPVLEEGYDFVAPYYLRYKLDGSITNTIAYNLTRALYGKRIRQPIGGDFALSNKIFASLLDYEVWTTNVARFGIDIWLTTMAIVRGAKIAQARLGVKIHEIKDPGTHLGPMFRQVVGTIYSLMEMHQNYWVRIKGSEEVPILGEPIPGEVVPFPINLENLVESFIVGLKNFGPVWHIILGRNTYRELENISQLPPENFYLSVETWVKIVYDFAIAYHRTPRHKEKFVDLMIPIYNARVASIVNELKNVEGEEVEEYYEGQAVVFEDMKPHLIERWYNIKEWEEKEIQSWVEKNHLGT